MINLLQNIHTYNTYVSVLLYDQMFNMFTIKIIYYDIL